jgi:hypothetical protein
LIAVPFTVRFAVPPHQQFDNPNAEHRGAIVGIDLAAA